MNFVSGEFQVGMMEVLIQKLRLGMLSYIFRFMVEYNKLETI